jgi:xanthosine utilization system XapX-like protein
VAVNIDWRAVRAGGSVALILAVPFSFAARWFADNDSHSSAPTWLSLLALIGFFVGSGIAAWVQRLDLPLAHGIVTAVLTYLAAQAVFIIVRLALGREVHWFALFFNLTAVAFVGLLGGFVGSAMHRRGMYPGSLDR